MMPLQIWLTTEHHPYIWHTAACAGIGPASRYRTLLTGGGEPSRRFAGDVEDQRGFSFRRTPQLQDSNDTGSEVIKV